MTTLPEIHICIQQPAGYVHSLGFVDQARYFRYQFRRLGARVTISKNRLRHDCVNFVFGAHLGFEPTLRERYACIFVNLEQVGDGRASAEYMRLLATSSVVDCEAINAAVYAGAAGDVTVVPLLHAPYLTPAHSIPLHERPIDLLFMGSVNERRKAWLARVEACGMTVSMFDGPLFGAERDHFLAQAKAVLNTPYYDWSPFEQVRVSHCLSVGTPVISERTQHYQPHQAFEDSVIWLEGDNLEQFFTKDFGTPAFYQAAQDAVLHFQQADPIDTYAELLAFAAGFGEGHRTIRPPQPWQPQRINLGSGKGYMPGWLNIDVLERAEPDLVLDLAKPLVLPLSAAAPGAGPILLAEDSVDVIQADNVLDRVPDLAGLMGNCLRLLKEGGTFGIEVPYDRALSAWQDPTHVRAMNENSWSYYTDSFWQLGWFDYRFEAIQFSYLDGSLKECAMEQAAFMRVFLRKVATSPRERTTARTMQAELRLPEDEVAPADACNLQLASSAGATAAG